jgi:hypothetical protein
MKRFLRFVKIFVAFFLVIAGGYGGWVLDHERSVVNKDAPNLICIALLAVGLTILWTDWRRESGIS